MFDELWEVEVSYSQAEAIQRVVSRFDGVSALPQVTLPNGNWTRISFDGLTAQNRQTVYDALDAEGLYLLPKCPVCQSKMVGGGGNMRKCSNCGNTWDKT